MGKQKKKEKLFQARQGDVGIFERATKAPKGKKIQRQGGRVILAAGEATGHHHAIASNGAELYALNEQMLERVLRVQRREALRHEEHAPIQLPAGDFDIEIQREYRWGSTRQVVD